jgi:hypothetical protein
MLIIQALQIAKNNLLYTWKKVVDAKSVEDIQQIVSSPSFHKNLSATFPEYESTRKMALAAFSRPNFYQEYIQPPINMTTQFAFFPLLIINGAQFIFTKITGENISFRNHPLLTGLLYYSLFRRGAFQSGLLGEFSQAWTTAIPSQFSLFWFGDFLIREIKAYSSGNWGFQLVNTPNGLYFEDAEKEINTNAYFALSAQGSPLLDASFFSALKDSYRSQIMGVYSQLATDIFIYSSLFRSVLPSNNSRGLQQ